MISMKSAVVPSTDGSRTRAGGLRPAISVGFPLWVALLLCGGLAPVWAQELSIELPRRVPAPFMTYEGAAWLERPERIVEEMPDAMLAAMGLEDGDVVADIGAGSGFHARRMARLVAPTGRVYAVDIQPEMLEILQGHVDEEGVTGVVPVLGEFDDPKLPEGEIDWILLVDVYHEFGDYEAMLAKMRQALKPDGSVALVEYRVEDGTGDHIKGDHRMSVRQVLSEWTPAGFDLVALHEFLPSQHLFIFQPASRDGAAGTDARPVVADYDVLEAIDAGLIEVSAAGLDSGTASLSIRRTRPEPMVITLPVGTYFESPGEEGVAIRSADERLAMRNVMWLFQGINLHPLVEPMVQQLALWIASEDADFDTLAGHAASRPIAPEEAVALAVAYVDSSGIDVTRKRIWMDRERFVPAVTDQGLKRFLEALEQR